MSSATGTWTRGNKADCYEHIFKTVFRLEDDDKLMNVFDQPTQDIHRILRLTFNEMSKLEYETIDDGGDAMLVKLPTLDFRVLQCFKAWMTIMKSKGDHPERDINAWKALTAQEFDAFCDSPECVALMEDHSLFRSYVSPTAVAASTKPSYTPADMFKKGIKRDKGSYPVLKRDADWAEFKGAMTIEANAQGVEDVLDEKHKPVSNDQINLFKEQQKFMLSVLERSMQTQNGKSIVRKHREDMNAQAAWVEICTVYESSVHATAEAADLLSYITTARLGDGKWKSGCENFIIHWDKACDDYDNLCDAGEQLGKGQRRTMLQNAVSDIDDLRAVKVTQDQLRSGTATGTTAVQSYDDYLQLLKSAAIGYDRKHGKFQTAAMNRSQVYQAEFDYGGNDGFDDDDPHDINTPVSALLQAYRTDVKTFLPQGVFGKLSVEDKARWFSISKDAQASIIGCQSKESPQTGQAQRRPRGHNQRHVNLADISGEDLLAIMSVCQAAMTTDQDEDVNNLADDDPNDQPDAATDSTDDNDATRQVAFLKAFMADSKLANAPAGHIAKVLSKKHARPPERRTKANVLTVYRMSSMATQLMKAALLDRGANGCIIAQETGDTDRS